MTPVKATRVASLDELFKEVTPDGAYIFQDVETQSGFKFQQLMCLCPCGCNSIRGIPLMREGQTKPDLDNGMGGKRPFWTWDGNEESPTLSPSIRDVGHCFYHGHLTNGEWTFTADSGQKP